MWRLIDILKPLKNNRSTKAVLISSEGQNKFTHMFYWEKLTFLFKFHQFKYPDLLLALDERVSDKTANTYLIKQCQKKSEWRRSIYVETMKKVSLKAVLSSLVKNLFTTEAFTENDVIKWLSGFDWDIVIVSLLSPLVVEGIIFAETSTGEQSYKGKLYLIAPSLFLIPFVCKTHQSVQLNEYFILCRSFTTSRRRYYW